MSSALETYANCTINLEIVSGYKFNEITLQEETVTVPYPVRAILQVDNKTNVTISENSGLDNQTLRVKGRCLNPVFIPPTVGFPLETKVVFDDGKKASFDMTLEIPNPYYNEVSLLGQPIHGILKYTG